MSLDTYVTLGRSGLVVSRLMLGTMTFGTDRWGTDDTRSEAIFNAFIDAGGTCIDTANVYSDGRSEEMIGKYCAARKLRDDIVIATKAGFSAGDGVLAGGNGAKHLNAALAASLRRLQTEYVDLYWIHVFDSVTPAEELLETMSGLVRSGKIRYWAISNAPAWYVAKIATLAAVRGRPGPIALQYFYSLVNRDLENEHVPLAEEFGMGIVPWSPLAYGFLTGKYDRADGQKRTPDAQRLNGANPFGETLFTERNWSIVDVLRRVAAETGQTPARLALAWVIGRSAITSTLIGVSSLEQFHDNVKALSLRLAPEHRAALDAVSEPEARMPYPLFKAAVRQDAVFGGHGVLTRHESAVELTG